MKYQRITKKGFRYEDLYITDNSARSIKEYSKFASIYNRLAELEDKIEKGALILRYVIVPELGFYYITEATPNERKVIDVYKSKIEAERVKEKLENGEPR